MPNIVLIIGPQAVGKMTVGQVLSKEIDYTLFHNHMTIELALALFGYDKNVWKKMNKKFRDEIFEEFSKSNQKGIVFTYCFEFGEHLESEYAIVTEWMSKFENAYVVELEADIEERLKRNATENRLKNKPSKRNLEWSNKDLLKSTENEKLNSAEGQGEKLFKNYMRINNTNLNPEEVVKLIRKKFNL